MTPQKGFTLVEIAIVLVIIGLLLGGAFKGLELVNNAKAKNIANDLRNISTFIYAYQDRFRALPGDDANVNTHLASANSAATAKIGNARIDGAWNSNNASDESFLFWQHVRLAGLTNGATNINEANYLARNSAGGVIGVTSEPILTRPSSAYFASFFVCSQSVSGRFVRQIDVLLDDGNTQTGAVRAITDNAPNAPDALLISPEMDAQNFTVCMGF